MKKYFVLLIMFYSLSIVTINAQAFKASNFNVDVGYVIGSHSGGFLSPGVMLSVEKGVHKWVGVGAYTGVQYNLPWFNNAHLSVPVGGAGSFHFYQMISDLVGKEIGTDKLDIAVKLAAGVRFDIGTNVSPVNFDWGASLKARYFFTENIGLYLEAGNPAMGRVVFGLAAKF